MSSTNSPCAACKFLRRKCTPECVFAPYFPPDQPKKFADVHKIFGASNVAKILNEIGTPYREDAVNSLAYEANARIENPVYGCVGLVSILQQRLKQVQVDLYNAKKELTKYVGPVAMAPLLQQQQPGYFQHHANNPSSSAAVLPYNMPPMAAVAVAEPAHSNQLVVHQQEVAEAREREVMLRAYEQQQQQLQQQQEHNHRHHEQQQQQHQQQEFLSLGSGFDSPGSVAGNGFNNNQVGTPSMSSSLVLGSFDSNSYGIHHEDHHHQQQQQQPHEHQLLPQLMLQQHQQQQRSGSEEGPSC